MSNEYTDLKKELEKEHSVVDHPKADLLFELAWSQGHSSGLEEVRLVYAEMVDLIKD